MKKRLFSAVLVLLFSVACSVMAVAATSGGDEADEVVRAGGFLFHFNRDRTALSLWKSSKSARSEATPIYSPSPFQPRIAPWAAPPL